MGRSVYGCIVQSPLPHMRFVWNLPHLLNTSMASTGMCYQFAASGTCSFGDRCKYNHGVNTDTSHKVSDHSLFSSFGESPLNVTRVDLPTINSSRLIDKARTRPLTNSLHSLNSLTTHPNHWWKSFIACVTRLDGSQMTKRRPALVKALKMPWCSNLIAFTGAMRAILVPGTSFVKCWGFLRYLKDWKHAERYTSIWMPFYPNDLTNWPSYGEKRRSKEHTLTWST